MIDLLYLRLSTWTINLDCLLDALHNYFSSPLDIMNDFETMHQQNAVCKWNFIDWIILSVISTNIRDSIIC